MSTLFIKSCLPCVYTKLSALYIKSYMHSAFRVNHIVQSSPRRISVLCLRLILRVSYSVYVKSCLLCTSRVVYSIYKELSTLYKELSTLYIKSCLLYIKSCLLCSIRVSYNTCYFTGHIIHVS